MALPTSQPVSSIVLCRLRYHALNAPGAQPARDALPAPHAPPARAAPRPLTSALREPPRYLHHQSPRETDNPRTNKVPLEPPNLRPAMTLQVQQQ